MTPALQAQYGSYEDYLNNVLKENNPMYNYELEDNEIDPGQSLDDKIFDKPEEPEKPSEPKPRVMSSMIRLIPLKRDEFKSEYFKILLFMLQ